MISEDSQNTLARIIFGLLLLLILIVSVKRHVGRAELDYKGIYRGAYVVDRAGAKGGVMLTYQFSHQGKVYKREGSTYRIDIAKGDSFYVKIVPEKPEGYTDFYKDTTEIIHRDRRIKYDKQFELLP